ncbi:MAG: cytochrome c [Alcaligenaceae bacterium]|nr:cytochrome c [Alcaligenaceae bacterium]
MNCKPCRSFAAACLAVISFGAWAAAPADSVDNELVLKGKYLATAGDCIACHTVAGGKPFAGGLHTPTPVGDIISTNITPSKTSGIGNYTLEQFTRVMREGIRADGKHLYPAMPYTAYAKTSDEDMRALYAYFMHGVEPVDTSPPPTQLPFPFNIRLSMAVWNMLFLDPTPFRPDPDQDAVWNRGAYLARGLTHCTTCHTPRNFLLAEDLSRELAGGQVGPWYAPNITSDERSGIGGWSTQEIVDYLATGHTAKAQASGPMAEAVDYSLSHLTEADLQALATYVKTVPAVHDAQDTKAVFAWGEAVDHLDTVRGVPWPSDPGQMTGAQLYSAHCATCHQAQAQGSFTGELPALFHNTATGRLQTNNLVLTILDGIQQHGKEPGTIMPGFRTVMSDAQVATLGNYLMQNYGNPAGTVSAEQVSTLRNGTVQSPVDLVLLARAGLVVAGLIILAIILAFALRRRRSSRRR